mmetsp:Transcript_16363/g.47065  ORF Transcript_16363/g.47065 Transcript_16363/m.47065 type:complete len:148 (-) Transcript_16363:100-543(-)
MTTANAISKSKPNQPCPCGSGRKYKKCCKNQLDLMKSRRRNNLDDFSSSRQSNACNPCKKRFCVGDQVQANVGNGSFQPGTIVTLNYREPGWLCDVPYQISLEGSGRLIYAPYDTDCCVQALPKYAKCSRRPREEISLGQMSFVNVM